jgi:hypothetical protein
LARTPAGALLTEEHRRGQLAIRARAIKDYPDLWPLWRGDRASFERLVEATVPLVQVHHQLSSSFATAYYETFRRLERVGGAAAPRAAVLDIEALRVSLYVTGEAMTRRAIEAGLSPTAAMQTALVRTSGSVTRHVLAGGRDTLVESTEADREARGWLRVTASSACAFCGMLASRSAAYLGEDTASFEAHDHCACGAEPLYEGSEPPPTTQEWDQRWNEAQRMAQETGELAELKAAGVNNPALVAFRNHLGRAA